MQHPPAHTKTGKETARVSYPPTRPPIHHPTNPQFTCLGRHMRHSSLERVAHVRLRVVHLDGQPKVSHLQQHSTQWGTADSFIARDSGCEGGRKGSSSANSGATSNRSRVRHAARPMHLQQAAPAGRQACLQALLLTLAVTPRPEPPVLFSMMLRACNSTVAMCAGRRFVSALTQPS